MFNNVIALDISAVLAALLTSICAAFDFGQLKPPQPSKTGLQEGRSACQNRLGAGSIWSEVIDMEPAGAPRLKGMMRITSHSPVQVAQRITNLLKTSEELGNAH